MIGPVRSYDKPGVLLAQLADGIATSGSVRRTLFDPAALSPREREDFGDRLKQELGGNAVADTVIDTLANPLVWLGVACSVGAAGAAAQSLSRGGRFFGAPTGAGAYARAKWPLLRGLGLTNFFMETVGMRVGRLVSRGVAVRERTRDELASIVQPEVRKVLDAVSRAHGGVRVDSLDPRRATDPRVRAALEEVNDAIHVRLAGWDQADVTRRLSGIEPDRHAARFYLNDPGRDSAQELRVEVPRERWNELKVVFDRGRPDGSHQQELDLMAHSAVLDAVPGERAGETMLQTLRRRGLDRAVFRLEDPSIVSGGARLAWRETPRNALVSDSAAVDRVLDAWDAHGLVDASRRMYDHGKAMLFGDEARWREHGVFSVDRDKVLRVVRGQLRTLRDGGYLTDSGNVLAEGEEAVRGLLGDEVASALIAASAQRGPGPRRGMKAHEIEDLVVSAVEGQLQDRFYLPRNTARAVGRDGRPVAYDPWRRDVMGHGGPKEGPAPSGRTMGRRGEDEDLAWDPDDLVRIGRRFGASRELDDLVREGRARRQGQLDSKGHAVMLSVSHDLAAVRYISSASRDYAIFAMDAAADPWVQSTMRDYGPGNASRTQYPGPVGAMGRAGHRSVAWNAPKGDDRRAAGGLSLFDMMDADIRAAGELDATGGRSSAWLARTWRRDVLPWALGIRSAEESSMGAQSSLMRETARRLADSRLMRSVEGMGSWGTRFVRQLRAWGEDRLGELGGGFEEGVTRLLYASHLGVNPGSAMINLLQPLQSVHHLGIRATARAYADAFSMMGEYMKGRAALGLNPTREELASLARRTLVRDVGGRRFDMTEVADLGGSFEMLDRTGYGRSAPAGPSRYGILERMMGLFQHSEMVNRLVTANAVVNSFLRAGRGGAPLDFERMAQDAHDATQQLQMGSGAMNRPTLFASGMLARPSLRMFMQYGLRSLANLFMMPEAMGGTRSVAGLQVDSKWGRIGVDLMRGLAVSAVAYEAGKNLLGMDLSRGLMLGGPADLVGGDRAATQKDAPMWTPPVVDIAWDAARWLATGDREALSEWAPRVVPGGVALSRMLGTLPGSDALMAVGLQRTYADWSQSASGLVPVYGDDGRYMGSYPGADLVMRAFGVDMGRFSQPRELEQTLLRNRDEIRDARRRYVAALLGNNVSAAESVRADFEARFGLPMTVTREHVRRAVDMRERSVVERTLSGIGSPEREALLDYARQAAPGQLVDAPVGDDVQGTDIYRWAAR